MNIKIKIVLYAYTYIKKKKDYHISSLIPTHGISTVGNYTRSNCQELEIYTNAITMVKWIRYKMTKFFHLFCIAYHSYPHIYNDCSI